MRPSRSTRHAVFAPILLVACGGGPRRVSETFMPAFDGTRLTIAAEASIGGPIAMELRRVYDRVGADGADPSRDTDAGTWALARRGCAG